MKKILKITFGIILLCIAALYLGVIFVLPSVINSKFTINKLQSFIHNKTGIETTIDGLNLKISPKLVVILNIDNISAKNNNVSVAEVEKLALNYKLLQKQLTSVCAGNIFIDGNYLKQFKKEGKKKDNTKPDLSKIPEVNIQNIEFKSDEINIRGENINTKDGLINLKVAINAPFLKETLKLGESGSLQVVENELKANKFKIALGSSNLYLDGIIINENKTPNLDIKGEKLPVSEIMPMLLHLQKSKDPSRKFIENFKNFNGTADVNLKLNKDGIWGTCTTNNLSANAIWFDIPLYSKQAVFNFRGKTVDSVAEGILGNEKFIHTLDVTKLGTPEKTVVGTMKTTLTPKFNSVPNLKVLNSVNVGLVYKIKDKKPDVYYDIDIPAGSDLIYNSFYLGLRDYKRKIHANTFKDDNNLSLKEYKYSYFDSNKENVIISGDGLFIKNIDKSNPDKFVPQYIACHTNGYAPISVTGSFGEKVTGGEFKGDLKYDFNSNQVLGTFDIANARHKAFNIERAHVVAKDGILNVTSNGLFKGEKYSAELKAKNNIIGETLVYNMKLLLDKLVFEIKPKEHKTNKKINPHEITKKVRDADVTINNWEIAVNEIKRETFVLQNVKLLGSMKNNVFDFKMNELNFADGIIKAKGIYDFAKNTSKMTFEAKNINSDKAAETTLNLKGQIEGVANAKVDIDARDMFRFLDAHCAFEVKEGFLPKLGDTELMIKNSKFKLSQIINLDLSQKDLMKDDIKGKFDVHNTEIKNIDITTWHELSAMYLEGNYEMEKQNADLQLFWHYSKEAPKGIRVFGVPLSFILKVAFRPEHTKELYLPKLSKIPQISADEKNSTYYRVKFQGDINNKNNKKNKMKLELKEIR